LDTDYEVALLKLLEKITNGTVVRVSHTGTTVSLVPGVLTGGAVEIDVPTSRSVGYYLEALVALGPYGKKPLNVLLTGCVTAPDSFGDPSADVLRAAILPFLSRAYDMDVSGCDVKVESRGNLPLGGGSVRLIMQPGRAMRPAIWIDPGKVKRIRGIATSARVSPALATRAANSCRAVLTKYIPDVFVFADAFKGLTSGKSPGFSVAVVAETTTGVMYSAECASRPRGEEPNPTEPITDPEIIGNVAAKGLLSVIAAGGCVDAACSWLAILYAATCSMELSKLSFPTVGEHGLDTST
jgi:RNA 3'-terminal phosphate cyclase-like protein